MSRKGFALPIALVLLGPYTQCAQPGSEAALKPIQVVVRFHLDVPAIRDPQNRGPTHTSVAIKRLTQLLERLGVKAEYAFVGVVLQQLAEDFPETIQQIKTLKLPIAYHGGAGHTEPSPVGRGSRPKLEGLSPAEVEKAEWESLWRFETRALVPDWRLDENGQLVRGNPRAGQALNLAELPFYRIPASESWLFGGWLAIQNTLGVTPLQTDALGHGPVYEALGAGYHISEGELELPPLMVPPDFEQRRDGIRVPFDLPELHEPHLFPGGRSIPPKYYGKPPGVDAPRTIDPVEWFEILARNLPRQKAFATGFLCHADVEWEPFERLMRQLASGRDAFRVAALDPESFQYRPENSPLAFYHKTYGVQSLAEVRSMKAPLEKIRALQERSDQGGRLTPPFTVPGRPGSTKRPKALAASQILEAADFLLCHWPQGTHDGDFGGPPAFLRIRDGMLSLADAFESLTVSLAEWQESNQLPKEVRLRGLDGPVDFPVVALQEEPKLDPEKRKTGYMPAEIHREFLPDPGLVNSQGLPPSGDFHVWIPTHTKVEAADMMVTVRTLGKELSGRVPGVIPVRMLSEDSRGKEPRWITVKVNPAEFLYALAQEYRAIHVRGEPAPVVLVSMKVTSTQRCQLVIPFTADTSRGAAVGPVRFEGFIWRAGLSKAELDRAWTQASPQ